MASVILAKTEAVYSSSSSFWVSVGHFRDLFPLDFEVSLGVTGAAKEEDCFSVALEAALEVTVALGTERPANGIMRLGLGLPFGPLDAASTTMMSSWNGDAAARSHSLKKSDALLRVASISLTAFWRIFEMVAR